MARSRSSFDLTGAIATAASLSAVQGEESPNASYRNLVSFSGAPGQSAPPPPMPSQAPATPRGQEPPIPISHAPDVPSSDGAFPVSSQGYADPPSEPAPMAEARRPPRLPDLSGVVSPTERCERIVAWIVEAVGAEDVFIADASGLPIAGAADAEARIAASGVVASAALHLAASIPGNHSQLFELHVGEGPFFQLIGFLVGPSVYLVGLTRATPLSYRQAHAVRLACGHALGEIGAAGGAA
jgi:hypothetical protein